MKPFTFIALLLLLGSTVSGQEIFRYKCAHVYKSSSDVLDTVTRWENGKLKETFELSGAIYYNPKKKYIKLRRFDDKSNNPNQVPMKNIRIIFKPAIVLLLVNSFLFSCEEDSPAKKPVTPTVSTNPITESEPTSALASGSVADKGSDPVTQKGFVYGKSVNPTIETSEITEEGEGTGDFESELIELESGKTYYVRAYAINKAGVAYGNEINFTTSVNLKELEISSDVTGVAKGLTNQFKVNGLYTDGSTADLTEEVSWTSEDSPVGSIDNAGLFHSEEMGTTTITATLGEISDDFSFEVYKEELVSIKVTAYKEVISPDGNTQVWAIGTYTDESEKDLTLEAEWAVSDENLVMMNETESELPMPTVQSFGDLGTAKVTATFGDFAGSLDIKVAVKIGEWFRGGYVFYIDETEKHGLIVSANDMSTGVRWASSWAYTDAPGLAPGTAVGTGKANSEAVFQALGTTGEAVRHVLVTTFSYYDDWYLPSIGELELICATLGSVEDETLREEYNLDGKTYWSSTDTNKSHNAHWLTIGSGCQPRTDLGRDEYFHVRGVREF